MNSRHRLIAPRLGGLILEGDIFDETMGVKRHQRLCALRHRPLMCLRRSGENATKGPWKTLETWKKGCNIWIYIYILYIHTYIYIIFIYIYTERECIISCDIHQIPMIPWFFWDVYPVDRFHGHLEGLRMIEKYQDSMGLRRCLWVWMAPHKYLTLRP